MKNLIIISTGCIAIAVTISSCTGDSTQASETIENFYGEINALPESVRNEKDELKAYILPTPLQISSAIKIYGFEYNAELLLSENKKTNYPSDFNNALNLGIYTIDLAYATVFENHIRSASYLGNINGLMNELGITGDYETKSLVKRFNTNREIQDSLYKIIMDGYEAGHNYFQRNGREGIGLLILTGCYIEGLHLTLGIKNTRSEMYENLMAQQKIFLDNITELLGYYIKAKDVNLLLQDLNSIKADFDKIELDFDNPQTQPYALKNKIDDNTVNALKTKVASLRNEIVS
ncbi:MAG: hypothetical protein COA57_02490 [Flavobacteriales bacterium]|nr:MAG: hypothetical protein COA57_02490 [Flavobacteriales bacterium]